MLPVEINVTIQNQKNRNMHKEILVPIVVLVSIVAAILSFLITYHTNIEAECDKQGKIAVKTISGYGCVDGFKINK